MAGAPGRSGGWNRKSAEAHRLAGTFRGDRHAAPASGNLAVLPTAAPRDPDEHEIRRVVKGLSRPQQALGRRLLAEYSGWTPADTMLLRLGLEALDRSAECRKQITADGGLVLKGKRGAMKAHPLLRVERSWSAFAAATLRALNLGGTK